MDAPRPRSDATAQDAELATPRTAPPRYAMVLISPHGVAHLPDKCNHHPDKTHRDAGWGWVVQPGEGVWEGISHENPLQATHGNAARVARQRCRHCRM